MWHRGRSLLSTIDLFVFVARRAISLRLQSFLFLLALAYVFGRKLQTLHIVLHVNLSHVGEVWT